MFEVLIRSKMRTFNYFIIAWAFNYVFLSLIGKLPFFSNDPITFYFLGFLLCIFLNNLMYKHIAGEKK